MPKEVSPSGQDPTRQERSLAGMLHWAGPEEGLRGLLLKYAKHHPQGGKALSLENRPSLGDPFAVSAE